MEINRIYTEDCLKTMGRMPDGFVDLTVTSPPYDNLRNYNGYVFEFEKIAQELYRIAKNGGVVVWVVGDSTIKGSETGSSFKQALCFKDIGFRLHDTMIYYRWSGPLTHNRYEQEFEYMFVFSKGKPKTFNPIMVDCKYYGEADRTGQFHPSHDEINSKMRSGKERGSIKSTRIDGNVWRINNASQAGERFKHPAPFPEELAHRHIVSWSNPGDLVYDPFMGSGTTAKMAIVNNRNYIGSEISEEYTEIANKRISEAQPAFIFI